MPRSLTRGREAEVGRTRARYRVSWPWQLWCGLLAIPVVLCGLLIVTKAWAAAFWLGLIFFVFAFLPIALHLRGFQVAITDRAVLTGHVSKRYWTSVMPLEHLDPTTVRIWSNIGATASALEVPKMLAGTLHTAWSHSGVSFYSDREWEMKTDGPLVENDFSRAGCGNMTMFALRRPRRFVNELGRALAPFHGGADPIPPIARTPQRLSGRPNSLEEEMPGYATSPKKRGEHGDDSVPPGGLLAPR